MDGATTVTVQDAVFPFADLAVTVAVPGATGSNPPVWSTVRIFVSEELHTRLFSVASSGCGNATKVLLSPYQAKLPNSHPMLDRGTLTVTLQAAVFPFAAVAVTVALPPPAAVILPPFTAATAPFDVLHVTVLSVASSGVTVAAKELHLCFLEHEFRLVEADSGDRYCNRHAACRRFTIGCPTRLTVVPPPTAVSFPFSTFTTAASDVLHVTVLSVAFSGVTVAVSCACALSEHEFRLVEADSETATSAMI